MLIENFAAIPEKDLHGFAEVLIRTINSEHTFTDDTSFQVNDVEPDELSGGVWIDIFQTDTIEVSREATWQAEDEDEAYHDPGYDADYNNTLIDDVKSAFKTFFAEIDGYKVSLEVRDADAVETVDVDVDNISQEDAGIGDYEYFGYRGTDSRPYVEVEGTIVKACECSLALYVEPIGAAETIESETDEEV